MRGPREYAPWINKKEGYVFMSEQETVEGCDKVAFESWDCAMNAMIAIVVGSTQWPDWPSTSFPVDNILHTRGAAWSMAFRLLVGMQNVSTPPPARARCVDEVSISSEIPCLGQRVKATPNHTTGRRRPSWMSVYILTCWSALSNKAVPLVIVLRQACMRKLYTCECADWSVKTKHIDPSWHFWAARSMTYDYGMHYHEYTPPPLGARAPGASCFEAVVLIRGSYAGAGAAYTITLGKINLQLGRKLSSRGGMQGRGAGGIHVPGHDTRSSARWDKNGVVRYS